METFRLLIANALTHALQKLSPTHPALEPAQLEFPKDLNHGDFSFPCFSLSKILKKAPNVASQEVLALLQSEPFKTDLKGIEATVIGPYLNFKIPAEAAARQILAEILSPSPKATAESNITTYGSLEKNSRGSWVLEYSSPNVAKPFQIYHLRPTALGAALARIGKFRGYHVTTINHLGDWGTQYGKLAVAFKLFAKDLPKEPTIFDLVSIYVKFHEVAKEKPELEDQAREAFRKLELDDPEMISLWKACRDISLKEFYRIYERIGVSFDHIWGESFYKDQLSPLLKQLKEKQLLVQSEGAWIVPLTDDKGAEMTPCILERSDGGTVYATRDIAAAIYRYNQFHFDRMTYIVGAEQKLHFQQIFGVLAKMGFDWTKKCEHVPTGLYRFKGGKMSTRQGNYVTLEDVLDLATSKVKEIMLSREKSAKDVEMSESEWEGTVEKIAMGAVIFHDLSSDPARDIEFDIDRVTDFDGETGPYVQYAHTRMLSILRKAKKENFMTGDFPEFSAVSLALLTHEKEARLIKTLGNFSYHLDRALTLSKASQLSSYLLDVVKAFNSFYRECHVLVANEKELSQARIQLVHASRLVLAKGLSLLGIPTPERM